MRCAILGDPVEHSLSPVLHRAAYAELGLGWTYDSVRVAAGGLAAYLDGLGPEWRGLSLTMPLKREVVALLTARDPWTEMSGAANTLLLDPDGGRHGLNTDVPGAEAALGRATGGTLRSALVLGGGATAASVLLALAERGLERATLAVREETRAADTVTAVARHPRPPHVEVTSLAELGRSAADIVVSTIPAAAQTEDVLTAVREVPVVFDVRYDPWPTPLAAAAAAEGRTVVGGLDLLLWQAVDQVRAMTGRFDVPVDAMRRAGEQALATRSPR
ncbi:MAG TPA: shikimate dehydrogenase [Nocardioides sp.]|uniref:shikimate dehydrogenase n=1 Tax=Nocardioides sp. TaxID=35761 RepID=UPI002F415964